MKESENEISGGAPEFSLDQDATALLCESVSKIQTLAGRALTEMGYRVFGADNEGDACRKIEAHTFSLIWLNEDFGGELLPGTGVIEYLNRLEMAQRRQMFVVLISSRLPTMDRMWAFQQSVDLIINERHLRDSVKAIRLALRERAQLYRTYSEAMQNLGLTV